MKTAKLEAPRPYVPHPIEIAWVEFCEKVDFNEARRAAGLAPVYLPIEAQRRASK